MNSKLNQLSPVLSELKIELPKESVVKALDRSFAKLGREAKIRGFRKGKVPRAVLARMFGDAVEAEVRAELVSTYLQEALKEHDIIPLSEPDIDAGPLAGKSDYEFTAKFETRQKVESMNLDGIELERHKISIPAETVDKQIEDMRGSMAELLDLDEPRPVAEGDLVKVHIKNWVEGEWQDPPWADQEIVVGLGKIEKEIEEALIGMNVEEEKVVDLGSESEIEEKRTRYMLRVDGIQGRKLPELDDEFAKDVGDYENLDALRASVEERLSKQAVQTEDRRVQDLFYDALRERNPLELPPTLLENQKGAFNMRVMSSLAMLGEQGPGEEEREAMKERADKAATESVHRHLLVVECARLENIEVTDEDVDEEMKKVAEENGWPLPMVRAEYAKEGRREELGHTMLEKKIFDFAAPKVKITEVDPPAESDPSAKPAESEEGEDQ